MASRAKALKTESGKKPPLGSGERFARLKASIASKGKVRDPGAVAAAIGRKKYGARRFAKLAAAGRKGTGRKGK